MGFGVVCIARAGGTPTHIVVFLNRFGPYPVHRWSVADIYVVRRGVVAGIPDLSRAQFTLTSHGEFGVVSRQVFAAECSVALPPGNLRHGKGFHCQYGVQKGGVL